MRKALVVLLAIFAITGAAWAQDAMLGPHNTNNAFGCQSCHTPHSAVLQGSGLYMWAMNVPTNTYTTYGVGSQGATTTFTPTVASGTTPDTQIHTVLCLSCHDGNFNTAMATAAGTTGGPVTGGYSTSAPITVGTTGKFGAGHGEMTTVAGNVVGTTAGDLTSNHPVHVVYPNGSSATASAIYTQDTIVKFWKATVSTTSASFQDNGTVYTYGHTARLYTANGTDAYVECSSCHNPHAWKSTLVNVAGTKSAVTTNHFIRGSYNSSADIANFCMSCHADKSAAWDGSGLQ